jgi:poly(hydroxyalkanoate) depolymerase family esterase
MMIDMNEVVRLTQAGKLTDAMALLRGEAASRSAPEGRATIDMVPPTRPGGGWTAPDFTAAAAGKAGRAAQAQMPEAVRNLLDGLGKFGSGAGLNLPGAKQSRPAAPLPAGARFEQHSFAGPAGARDYKLYVPSGDRGEPLPLVVMLHGCTQSPDDFAAGTQMNELAEKSGFLVAYPAQNQSANASKCWNWFSAADQVRDQGEPSLIAGITREIIRDHGADPARVYVAGLSAGGAAAATLGALYPDLYAAIGVHSGLACGAATDMPSAFTAMRQGGTPRARGGKAAGRVVPTIVFHGDGDKTVAPVNGDQVIAQAQTEAALSTTRSEGRSPGGMAFTRIVQADAAGRPVLEQWVLHGAGHAWSGGSPAGSYTDPRGPDASGEMMRFFRQHSVATR